MIERRTYGDIIHIILYYYIKNRSKIRSKSMLTKIILENINVFEGRVNKQNIKKYVDIVWKVINKKKTTRFITFIQKYLKSGYKIEVERPLYTVEVKVYKNGKIRKKFKGYRVDLFIINRKKKHIVIVDIKAGTRRRIRSYKKKMIEYIKSAKSLFGEGWKVEGYIYWFRYDDLLKVELSEDK